MFDAWGTGEWVFTLAFLAQFGGVVWMIATMHQRVKDMDDRIRDIEDHNIGEELATINQKLEHITKWIDKQG